MNRIRLSFPSPSKSLLRFILLLKVGIVIALLVAGFNLSGCTRQNLVLVGTPLEWKDAEGIPQETLYSFIQQSTSLSLEQQKTVPVQIAYLHGKEELFFLNFSQASELCGELGCLIVAFQANRPHSLAWSTYLSPNLPKSIPLIAQTGTQSVRSLIVNQLEGNQIRQMLYAWNGSEYHLEKSIKVNGY
ncbi:MULTISPECIES: hypothetical protein [Leptolyngbya]|uniref:hypothetical protein n=1 Tax=Leptolyngbya TaxID=47251 RepID=UPI001689F938|nr:MULTISPECIES: hypothetical protein [unclassified Leptolyngbya]MBD1855524.1 hypothetical protein [Leptolyngbya sp. FACHB-1624]MBN8563565.1 hypothetical protein [Leptolyngbya sp. UWPOB_LEPTO1]